MYSGYLGGLVATGTLLLITGYYIYRRQLRKELRVVGTISKLSVFPIKSCAGIDINSALCTKVGLQGNGIKDRQWLVLDSDDHFVTMKQYPKLARIKTKISQCGQYLCLSAKEMPSIEILLSAPEKELVKTRYHGLPFDVTHCGNEAAEWLCRYLNKDGFKLIKSDDMGWDLTTDPKWGSLHKPGEKAYFHDESQFHLCTEDSLADLNTRLDKPIPVDTFRPNIVIKGSSPYEEDSWSSINIGGKVTFRKSFQTGRCLKTTVDMETDQLVDEPLATLRKYRMCEGPEKKRYGTCPLFGIHLVATNYGTINVGDTVYAY